MTIRSSIMQNKNLSAKQRKAALMGLTRLVCGEGTFHISTTRYDQKGGTYFIADYVSREVKSNGYIVRLSKVRMTDYPVSRYNLRKVSIDVEEGEKKITILY